MRTFGLLAAAMLWAMPACAQELWEPPQSTVGEILPFAVTCTRLDDLRAIIMAAERGGQYASNLAFKKINFTSRNDRPRCAAVEIEGLKASRMRAIEAYPLVESLVGSLRNIVIVETKVRRKKFFLAIEREAGPGNAI